MNHKSLKKERIKKQFYYILSDQPKSRESKALKGIQTMMKYTLSVHLAHPLWHTLTYFMKWGWYTYPPWNNMKMMRGRGKLVSSTTYTRDDIYSQAWQRLSQTLLNLGRNNVISRISTHEKQRWSRFSKQAMNIIEILWGRWKVNTDSNNLRR